MTTSCIVVGVGPGLGAAIAERFARAGLPVGLVARKEASTAPVAAAITALGGKVAAAHADVGDEAALTAAIASLTASIGPASVLVYNATGFARGSILETKPSVFEAAFRVSCLGAVAASRAVLPAMLEAGAGTLLFTGATASLRGSALFAPFAVSKFALRALAQSIARELGPKGIHVAHVLVDGGVSKRGAGGGLQPDHVAESYFQLYAQPRSAWTQELDLRAFDEKF